MAKQLTASVLAFEKKFVPSDGFMYGTTWTTRYQDKMPLTLQEKSVRGTISNRLKKTLKSDPIKLDAEVGRPNLQRIDSCALSPEQDTLALRFSLKVLSGIEQPAACNNEAFLAAYQQAAQAYIEKQSFAKLAKRYAINLANGRFLWRNRVGAEKIEVMIAILNQDKPETLYFDALSLTTRHFNQDSSEIQKLADHIERALSGQTSFLLLEVMAFSQIGTAQDVYPSEELVLDKSNMKGQKSKILYSVKQQAAMHSQKIGNALRSIDTWYPSFDKVTTGPIAIEPYGAVTNLGKAYRPPTEKMDFYTLFDRFIQGQSLEIDQQHYVMAVLVRGGVFGESGKEA